MGGGRRKHSHNRVDGEVPRLGHKAGLRKLWVEEGVKALLKTHKATVKYRSVEDIRSVSGANGLPRWSTRE